MFLTFESITRWLECKVFISLSMRYNRLFIWFISFSNLITDQINTPTAMNMNIQYDVNIDEKKRAVCRPLLS